jgi:hypothetical protein
MAEDFFESLASEEPDREAIVEEDGIKAPISAMEAEANSPNDSDLESTLKRLFPNFENEDIKEIAPVIMLGRIFPENFSTKIYLLVCNLAEKHSDDPNFDVWKTETIIEGLCQIGIEGKGRVEAVIVSGNTKEQAEAENNKFGGL